MSAVLEPSVLDSSRLTEREREIVSLVREGLFDKELRKRLFLSPEALEAHLETIFEKLGLHDRLELAIYAGRHGL